MSQPIDPTLARDHAARLGGWLMVSSQVLLVGAALAVYFAMRSAYPDTFAAASRVLYPGFGAAAVLVLGLGTYFAVLARGAARSNVDGEKDGAVSELLMGAILASLTFLAIKFFELRSLRLAGLLPGDDFRIDVIDRPHAELFIGVYLLLTLVHALQVGAAAILWFRVKRDFRKNYLADGDLTGLETAGMQLHMCTLTGVFLFPLLYLVR